MDDILQNAPCGYVCFDDAGLILKANSTFARMLGRPAEELVGVKVDSLFTVGARVFYQTHFFPMLKLHGEVSEVYLSLLTKSKESLPVMANAVRTTNGNTAVYDCVIVAMRQREQFENELLSAKKSAELANAEKASALNDLKSAYISLEQQTSELEAQATELDAQRDAASKLNLVLAQDVRSRKAVEKKLRKLLDRESLIQLIGQSVRESTDSIEVQRIATEALAKELKADRCFITQIDSLNSKIWIDVDWHMPELDSIIVETSISDTPISCFGVLRVNSLSIVRDVNSITPSESFLAPILRGWGLSSAICVGLFQNNVLVAVFTVGLVRKFRRWSKGDASLTQSIATQVHSALALLRVRKREQKIANDLQEALRSQPAEIPGVSLDTYYKPAFDESEVGGDFIDVFQITKNTYAIVVADVSGKGLQAAAQIAQIRHMLRTVLYLQSASLRDSVGSINLMLSEHNLLHGFATLFVGVYDSDCRTFSFVSCGQEPGLLRRSQSKTIQRLGPTGPILGVNTAFMFKEETLELKGGDIISLFTDGITEAGKKRSSMIGIEGAESIFLSATDETSNPPEIVFKMTQGVVDIATNAGLRDDICLLVMTVEP